MTDIVGWHMYLILFIVMIVFIGIVLFLERAKKQPKDPLSIWNPDNYSLYFDSDTKSRFSHDNPYGPHGLNDPIYDPAFSSLRGNIYHHSSDD